MYADIIVDITHEKLDKVFQYNIPSNLEGTLFIGEEVIIPFGRGNKEISGYIISFSKECDYDKDKIKDVIGPADKKMAIEGRLVTLAWWMKEHYGGTMIQALKTVLPIKKKEKAKLKRRVRLLLSKEEAEEKLEFYLHKNQKARARLIAALLDENEIDYELIIGKLNITLSVVKALEEQGVCILESEQVYRNPVKGSVKESNITYTNEQENAINTFLSDYVKKERKTYLIHGVTGSGKTEVYIEMIRNVIADGRQAIVLIPEIALTYQTVMRFYRNFGDRVSIINSRLSAGERYDQLMRAKNGDIDVMIGPRSALFTPFPQLGLIVIDEEHELTYKSEQVPRYHAVDTAIKRGELEGASVVLGSATPSVDSMYRAKKGDYVLLEMKKRSMDNKMADVEIVDLREELRSGNKSIISRRLYDLMKEALDRKEQIMLFLNRRGFSGFISCRECGHVIKCPHCDVSLSYHRNGKMVCHYCGYETTKPSVCPECGSKHIGGFKAGTQQIEDMVKKLFPEARVLRMDMDTTKEKDGHEKILSAFANEEADILVGTQMIVKGHDFPNVTLVGILAADMSLFSDDYRSAERTFQLLTQAEGRAGRGSKEGKAVIQTYSPEHYGIVTAANQDYEAFYNEELEYRDLMGYPPCENLLAVLCTCNDEELLCTACDYLKKFAVVASKDEKVTIIGPATPGISKINDVYRKVIYLKTPRYGTLIRIKNFLEQYIEMNKGFNKVRVQFDFNPVNSF